MHPGEHHASCTLKTIKQLLGLVVGFPVSMHMFVACFFYYIHTYANSSTIHECDNHMRDLQTIYIRGVNQMLILNNSKTCWRR